MFQEDLLQCTGVTNESKEFKKVFSEKLKIW